MSETSSPRSLLDRTDRNRDAVKFLVVPHIVVTAVVVAVVVGLVTAWWIGLVAAALSAALVAVLLPKSAASAAKSCRH